MAGAWRDSASRELYAVSLKLLSRTMDASSPWPPRMPTLGQWLQSHWPQEFTDTPVQLLQTKIQEAIAHIAKDEIVPDTAIEYVRAISLLFDPETSEHLRGMKEGKHYSHVLDLLVSQAKIPHRTKHTVELMSKRIRLRLADALQDTVPADPAASEPSNTAENSESQNDREQNTLTRQDVEPPAQSDHKLPDNALSADSSDFHNPLSVCLVVDLDEATTGRLRCSATVTSSDFDAWFVEMLAVRADGRPPPSVSVEVRTDCVELTFNYNNGVSDSWDRSRVLREFKTGLLSVYSKTVDVLVRETARIGVQYMHYYYKTPEDLGYLIEAVLNRDWMWDDASTVGVRTGEAWIDDATSMHLRIPADARTTDGGQPLHYQPEYLSDLALWYLIKAGLPAIISRGLKGGREHDPERFFDPGNWRIDLS